MTVQERMTRDDIEDKIYLGQLVERMFVGEAGQLFRALCNDIKMKTSEASQREGSRLPADRYLGRIEGVDKLTDYLVTIVANMKRLQKEQLEEARL